MDKAKTSSSPPPSFSTLSKCSSYMRDIPSMCRAKLYGSIETTLTYVAIVSVKNPARTIFGLVAFAVMIIFLGLKTNFRFENDGFILWTPLDSTSLTHGNWVRSEDSGFPLDGRAIQIIIHKKNEESMLTKEGMRRVFDVTDVLHSTKGFEQLCGDFMSSDKARSCSFQSPTRFWMNDRSLFEEQVITDDDVVIALSALSYPSGGSVHRPAIFGMAGNSQPPPMSLGQSNETEDILLESVVAYMVVLVLPPNPNLALPYEASVGDRLFALRREWGRTADGHGSQFSLEFQTQRSFNDELLRGIQADIPFVALAYIMMGGFCACTLYKKNPVRSQTLLGAGAVFTIVLSIMTGYGLGMLCGVPFTSLLQIFPYVMVGIGLDDTFIIMGAYSRTCSSDPIEKRIGHVFREVGVSITVSTITTSVAFMLGAFSSLPSLRWFSFYAGPTVAIDFFYQVTFFLALVSMDDRRQKSARRDCLPCCVHARHDSLIHDEEEMIVCYNVPSGETGAVLSNEEDRVETGGSANPQTSKEDQNVLVDSDLVDREQSTSVFASKSDQCDGGLGGESTPSAWSSSSQSATSQKGSEPRSHNQNQDYFSSFFDWLLRPASRCLILLVFGALVCFGAIGATRVENKFDYRSLTPPDSYVRSYFDALHHFFVAEQASRTSTSYCYFRDMDVSIPANQDDMISFVEDMADLDIVGGFPRSFWLLEFRSFLEKEQTLASFPFEKQLDVFLSAEPYRTNYLTDIVRDEDMRVVASRAMFHFSNVDVLDKQNQVDALKKQYQVAKSQTINSGRKEGQWRVFSFGVAYYIWELYAVITREVFQGAALGLLSVFIVALVFLSHVGGAFIVTPLVLAIYVELMALLYVADTPINVTSCVGLTMSIGLVVDYNMHVIHTFLETSGVSREDRVKKAMNTIGKSIMMGGISTFLGVIPLAFSQSEVFRSFFFTYLGIVVFGASHGLILLPTILSLVGPQAVSHLDGGQAEDKAATDPAESMDKTDPPEFSFSPQDKVAQLAEF